MKKYFSACLLLMICMILKSQPLVLRNLGMESGLSNLLVTDIEKDQKGFIWVATEAGLNCFDGRRFRTFLKSNSNLSGNALNALLFDKKENRLWVGSKTGLSIMDRTTMKFERIPALDSLNISNIVSLSYSAAPDSNIWVADHYYDIALCHRQSGKVVMHLSAAKLKFPSSFRCVLDNGKGQLYIGHEGDGFTIFDLKRQKFRNYRNDSQNLHSLPGNDVFCFCIDHIGNLWLGTNNGLALYRPETDDFIAFRHNQKNPFSLVSDIIYDIREMHDGTLWIASDIGGVNILDLSQISFQSPDDVKFRSIDVTYDKYGLSSGNIRSLLEDDYGNVWIGNRSSGVDFVGHSLPPFHVLPYRKRGQDVKLENVVGICSYGNDGVWLGGMNEVALFCKGKEIRRIDLTPYLTRAYAQVAALLCDGDMLYVGMYDDGVLRIHLPSGKVERLYFEHSEKSLSVYAFYKEKEGKIWVGTVRGLYYLDKGKNICPEETVNKKIQSVSVFGIFRDRQDKLWIGTYGDGIYVFDKSNTFLHHWGEANGLVSNTVHQFSGKNGGGIWGALRGGIVCFPDTSNPENFKCYDTRDGLQDEYIHALMEDGNANVWFSSDKGISCYNERGKKLYDYGYSYGVPMGSFSDAAVCMTKDSTFYFASQNGVCYFHPLDLQKKEVCAPVQIIDFQIIMEDSGNTDAQDIMLDNIPIQLSYKQNTFCILFSVSDYAQSTQVEYAYKMEGLGHEWIRFRENDPVVFRNMAPGKYEFRVKVRLLNQDWRDEEATLVIEVLPPFWSTWYAKLFYLLIFVLGLVLVFRLYRRRLILANSLEMERREMLNQQKLNNERLRFYTNITHELRTPLTLIIGPLGDLMDDTKLPLSYTRKINLIHRSALHLLELVNQILDFRKVESQNRKLIVAKGDLKSLLLEVGLRYKELNRNEKVQFEINIEETAQTILYFDSDIITTILNNLLSNAIKYTPEGKINLTLRTIGEYTEIEVSDTGYGISSEALPHIFECYYQAEGKHQASGTGIGLALVKSLADLHEGVLKVSSEVDKGTSIVLAIQTNNTYPNALHKDVSEVEDIQDKYMTDETEKKKADCPLILVVEDNDDIREYISASLEDYRVILAKNGKEGWEKTQKEIPDVVISDVMMPVMDGFELCRLIKKDMRTSHIPVILLTAKDSIQDKEEGYGCGADSYLTKPFSAKLLEVRICNLLEARRNLASLINNQGKENVLVNEAEPLQLNKLDKKFLDELIKIIELNVNTEKLDMPFIAAQMHMSHSTLYRKIKGLLGISGTEFIRRIRLRYSLRLMLEEGYNISEAAYAAGFSDVGYFRNCFKGEYGMTPSDYMKQQKSSTSVKYNMGENDE